MDINTAVPTHFGWNCVHIKEYGWNPNAKQVEGDSLDGVWNTVHQGNYSWKGFFIVLSINEGNISYLISTRYWK
jgi:hypothetical protein